MGELARGVAASVFVLLLLAPASASAAVDFDFTVNPNPPNMGQEATFTLTPTSGVQLDRVRWDLDGDDDFDDGSTRVVRHTYANRGPVTVRMRAREHDEREQTVTKTIVVNGPPAADFDFAPASPFATQAVSFTPDVSDAEGDSVTLVWRFGDGATAGGPSPSHAYSDPGTYSVVLTATDEHGLSTTRTRSVTVKPDPGPKPNFEYEPASPLTDEPVTFRSTSRASFGSIVATVWDLDGDGAFDDASGAEVTWAFATAGDHVVQMRVTQSNGRQAVAFANVPVAQRPAPPTDGEPAGPGPGGEPAPTPAGPAQPGSPVVPAQPKPPVMMRPFPIVRIAGVVLPNGALIRILSVRAPRGSSIRIRCRGKGCPAATVARTSATRLVRFRRFERRLRAGVKLEIFVRKAGKVGKYTRFLIRGGKPPARMDRCLMPGKRRPVACP